MGTNFYMPEKDPKDPEGLVHIGKYSVGWVFLFHAYVATGSVAQWKERLCLYDHVLDEYGNQYTIEDFWKIVYLSRGRRMHSGGWIDPSGFQMYDQDFC